MNGRRLMLAGRLTDAPLPIAGGGGGDFGELLSISVPNGAKLSTWAAFRSPDQRLDRPLAAGDAVAIVGVVDPDRRGVGALQGPITVEAVLGLGANGDIFRNS